jgi:hypothetical protein
MKMQSVPIVQKELYIFKVCILYETIGVEHKIKLSSVEIGYSI